MIDASLTKNIRVLVANDSLVVTQLITKILESSGGIKVIATAMNGYDAIAQVARHKPDVVLMDYHMPKMNGLIATRKLMETHPLPIIIMSATLVREEFSLPFQVLDAGAVALVDAPIGIQHTNYEKAASDLVKTVRSMSEVKVVRRWVREEKKASIEHHLPSLDTLVKGPVKLVAIGASTGGPVIIKMILSGLPKPFPLPIIIVQHIAAGFTQGLADWLSQTTGLPIHVANSGEELHPGHVYLAPDGMHMILDKEDRLTLQKSAVMNGHCPSVGALFRSVAETLGSQAIGILLTGMGNDGSVELGLMKEKGALTIVQDKESSVVYGMPGEAVRLDTAVMVLTPTEMIATLTKLTESLVRVH